MIKLEWTEEELLAARPPERLTLTEWACKYRELGKLSGVKGLYPIELTPFFRPIMDRLTSIDVDQQTIVKPAQIGGTVAFVENPAGYYMHQRPASMMVCLADEDTAKYVAAEKLIPMFKDSVAMSHLFDKKTFTNKGISTPNGARLDLAWASSVAKIATKPIQIVICDEVDKPGYSTSSKEASSISLIKERVKSFAAGEYKIILLSTPTNEEGNIIQHMNSADIILDWHVPCGYCGTYQPLRWSKEHTYGFDDGTFLGNDGKTHDFGSVVWNGGSQASKKQIKESSRYKCGTCGKMWTNAQKNDAVSKGVESPRFKSHGGERKYANHINRVYSLMDAGKLENLVSEWCSIFRFSKEKQIGQLQGFINSCLAEPFSTVKKLDNHTEDKILKARVDIAQQLVPENAVALVAFVDCQKYDFWFTVRAFAADHTSWLIHYGRLQTWGDVEELLFENRYPQIGSSKTMRVWRAGIDTGGGGGRYESESMTEIAYQWLRTNQRGKGCRVWGVKGSSVGFNGAELIRVGKPLDKTPAGKPIPGGLQIISIDTFKLKTMFHVRLGAAIERNTEARPAYLHSEVGQDYVRQILAEELKINDKAVEVWSQIGNRPNHLLDAEVGCMALADPEWPGGGVNLIRKASDPSQPQTGAAKGRRVISRGLEL